MWSSSREEAFSEILITVRRSFVPLCIVYGTRVTTHVVPFREAVSPFPQPDHAVGGDLDLLQWVVRILHLVARAPSEVPGGNGNGRGNGEHRNISNYRGNGIDVCNGYDNG